LDSALHAWLDRIGDRQEFNGSALATEPRVSASARWRYWRARLADGGRVEVTINERPDGRIALSIQHRQLADKSTADAWKAFWKQVLRSLRGG